MFDENKSGYRLLSKAEMTLIRAAHPTMETLRWDNLPYADAERRDLALKAFHYLQVIEYACVRVNGELLMAATDESGNHFAITPNLQKGVTKEMLRTVEKEWRLWDRRRFLNQYPGTSVTTFCLCMSFLFVLLVWLLGSADYPLSRLLVTLGIMAQISLIISFVLMWRHHKNHYQRLADLGKAVLELQTAKTPEEIAADNAKIAERMPVSYVSKETAQTGSSQPYPAAPPAPAI